MSTATGKDLLEYGLRRANELKAEQNTDFVPDLQDYINLAYWDIVGEFPWLWAMRYPPTAITTLRSIATVVEATEGSNTLLIASPISISVVGRKLLLVDDGIVMRIVDQHPTNLIVSGTCPVSRVSVPGTVFQDEYAIPADIAIPTQVKRVTGGELEIMSTEIFDAAFGRNTAFHRPVACCFITGEKLRIGAVPEEPEMLEVWHTYIPPELDFSGSAVSDVPILPFHIRWIIADRALYYLLTDMEDPKAAAIIQNSSVRLAQEKDRHGAKWRPRFWIPKQFRIGRSRV